jgi:large-conductance mechanosensitive channel
MIQEIITYMIIGAAVALAISKMINKTGIRKSREKKIDYKSASINIHNCSDCSAECMLRDSAKPVIEKNKELCKEIELRQKL